MQPKLRLSRLRDIGWRLWDPIGMLDEGDTWEGKPFADEYDAYLVNAAGSLRRGMSEEVVVNYLHKIEADHMGLGSTVGMDTRIMKVVKAIKADTKLWNMG